MVYWTWNWAIPLSLVQGFAKYGAAVVFVRLEKVEQSL